MEFSNISESTPVKDAAPNPTLFPINDMKREHESVDDFEHLEISPSKEKSNTIMSDPLFNLGTGKDLPASSNVSSQPNFLEQSNTSHPFSQPEDSSKDIISGLNEKSIFSSKTEALDDFLKDSSLEKPSSPVGFEVSKFLEAETRDVKKPETGDVSDFSNFLVDNGDAVTSGVKDSTKNDSSPQIGDFIHDRAIEHDFLNEPSNFANQNDKLIDVTPDKTLKKSVAPEPPANVDLIQQEARKPDPFELMNEKHTSPPSEPEIPSIPSITPTKQDPVVKDVPVSTIIDDVPKTASDSIKSSDIKPDTIGKSATNEEAPVVIPDSLPVKKPDTFSKAQSDDYEIKVDEVFRRIGLDSWFKPETLHPQVEALVYWRDPKKSGAVFGTILVALLSLTYYSFISVVAYFSLIILCGTICFKIYKSVLQAVQKTSDGHPFKEILELELTLPQEKVREVTDVAVTHFNAAVIELRRLFLVEDLVDSIKFAVMLWLLTRVGAWFNGMTLIIIAFIALFSVPKIYENNKAQVDANLAIVQSKLQEITAKIRAVLPLKKEAEKDKEQ